MQHFNLTKLLLGGTLFLSLSACNKEPADIAQMPADYDLKSAINELPTENGTEVVNLDGLPVAQDNYTSKEDKVLTLERAIETNDKEAIIQLLKEDIINPNQKTADGEPLLTLAVRNNSAFAVERLLALGANVNITDNEGRTALLQATRPYSPDPEIQGCEDKMDVIKELISAGANVNVISKEGQSPLFYAVYTGNTEVVKLLLAAGADVNIKFDGETVLQRAKDEEYTEIVELLKQAGAKE